jgi:hypothetical protein
VSSLDRTLSFSDGDSFALSIAEYLDFNVMARRVIALYEKTGIFEQGFASGLHCLE